MSILIVIFLGISNIISPSEISFIALYCSFFSVSEISNFILFVIFKEFFLAQLIKNYIHKYLHHLRRLYLSLNKEEKININLLYSIKDSYLIKYITKKNIIF